METNNGYSPDQALRDAANAQADILIVPGARPLEPLTIASIVVAVATMVVSPVLPSPWAFIVSAISVVLALAICVVILIVLPRSGVMTLIPKIPFRVVRGPVILVIAGFVLYWVVRATVDRTDSSQWIAAAAGLLFAAVVLVAMLWGRRAFHGMIASLRSGAASDGVPR